MSDQGPDLETLRSYFAKDAFANACGIELIEASDGHAVARGTIDEKHLNGIGLAHGGLLFTLADLACAAAVHTRGRVAVSINNAITYVKAAQGGTLKAEATEVSRNNRLASYTVNILNEAGEIIALFQGLAYVKAQKLP
jgi:acyl-CoA thioesterase